MLTWTKENGEWGLNNFDIKKVPRKLYGAIYKLHDYEKTGLEPEEVQGLMECRERIVKQLKDRMKEDIVPYKKN